MKESTAESIWPQANRWPASCQASRTAPVVLDLRRKLEYFDDRGNSRRRIHPGKLS